MLTLEHPTRILFFTGKGGVGKTSLACATAISLTDAGKRVLLVSTDPASNLDEVLDVALAAEARPVPGVAGLQALNIDPEEAARAYRERVVGPYRDLLPPSAIASMEEQLSGACTLEIAAFDEFSKLLGDPEATAAYDHLVFDTAPTGHTLRLLELPAAWSSFIDSNVGGTSCLGPLAGLKQQEQLYLNSRQILGDAGMTTLVLVARPDQASLQEAERTRVELAALGVKNQHLAVNGVFQASEPRDEIARAKEAQGSLALESLSPGLASLSRTDIPLRPWQLLGIAALRGLSNGQAPPMLGASEERELPTSPPLEELVEELARSPHGVVMTMGKGGVGKTTVAARIAMELANRGRKVLLTTTDPAAHVAHAVDGGHPRLTVTRIDPREETRAYAQAVMETAGADLDERGRALLEEDLRSPCTEEIAVFRAFAETVARGEDQIVVIDTAPTGHTILLLDAAEAYHREVLRKPGASPESVKELLPRLRDANFTRVLLVTLPEATPVHEAMSLEKDLVRAGITPFAWVVNQSLTPLEVSDPVLQAKRLAEAPFLGEVSQRAQRFAVEPWTAAIKPAAVAAR